MLNFEATSQFRPVTCSGAVRGPRPRVGQHRPERLTAGVPELEGGSSRSPEAGLPELGCSGHIGAGARTSAGDKQSLYAVPTASMQITVGVRWRPRGDKNVVAEFWRLLLQLGRPDSHADSVGAASGGGRGRGRPYRTSPVMLFEARAGAFQAGRLLCFPPGGSEEASVTDLPAGWCPLLLRIRLLTSE